MHLSASVMFDGTCEEAFQFYVSVFGGTMTSLSYGDSPMASSVPPDWQSKVVHATLTFGENQLSGADVFPPAYQRPAGFALLLGVDAPAEAERVFERLSDGGVVNVPIQQTFWSVRYGNVTDRFGIRWEINCAQAPEAAAGATR